jgi:hypothetical protein
MWRWEVEIVLLMEWLKSRKALVSVGSREYLDSKDMGIAILSEYERRGYTYEAAHPRGPGD